MHCTLNAVVVVSIIGFLSPQLLALDKSRLWLPNKYKELMPKLVDTAMQAEKTSRCQWVINGEISLSKSTEQHYHFIITCRDENKRSYILNYLYPIDAEQAKLVAEQGGRSSSGQTNVPDGDGASEQEDSGLNEQAVLGICREALIAETDAMDDVVVIEEGVVNEAELPESFFFRLPFNSSSELGAEVRYRADCSVDAYGAAGIEIFLEPEGALALCRESLKEETLIMRRVAVLDDQIELSRTAGGGFSYQMPFDATVLGGHKGHYRAHCNVDAEGNSEVSVGIDKDTVVSMCLEKLKDKTRTMINVTIVDKDSVTVQQHEDRYSSSIAFDANSPAGKLLHYQANCRVNSIGLATVTIAARRK